MGTVMKTILADDARNLVDSVLYNAYDELMSAMFQIPGHEEYSFADLGVVAAHLRAIAHACGCAEEFDQGLQGALPNDRLNSILQADRPDEWNRIALFDSGASQVRDETVGIDLSVASQTDREHSLGVA